MKKSKEKKKSILFRVVLLAFSVYILITAGSLQLQLIQKKAELDELTKRRDETQIKVEELKSLLENGTEADFIERAAREKLNYAYSDEQVFIDLSGN